MARDDKLKLGTFVYTFGFNPAAWLHPAADVNGANRIDHLLNVAKFPKRQSSTSCSWPILRQPPSVMPKHSPARRPR